LRRVRVASGKICRVARRNRYFSTSLELAFQMAEALKDERAALRVAAQ
jgi:hypothetical protein